MLTTVTSNVAALGSVPETLGSVLRSAQDPNSSHATGGGGVFLWGESDHLGTWHTYGATLEECNVNGDARAPTHFLLVVLEEVKAVQDAQLIEAVQEVEWHGDTFCLYDLGFAWGSGKNEIKPLSGLFCLTSA
eukprot:g342.t1